MFLTIPGVIVSPSSFNQEKFFSRLSTVSLGRTLLHVEVMGSAFDPLLAVDEIIADGLAVLADVQLSGVGRGGNRWISNRGCLMTAFQFLAGPRTPLGSNMPYLNILVGLAAAEAVRRLNGGVPLVRLKWPNDLFIGESKVGGVMIYTQPQTGGEYKGQICFQVCVTFQFSRQKNHCYSCDWS